jgi:ribose 5-phosphate isomerase B
VRIVVGSDHAGLRLKDHLAAYCAERGHDVQDVGTRSSETSDYPDFAEQVALGIISGSADAGIAVCGSGIGIAIAANKLRGIRAARCTSEYDARVARAHNDANVLALGERVTGAGHAEAIVDVFLATAFEGGRHARRVAKIDALSSGASEESD